MLAAAGPARGLWRAVPRVAPRVVPRAAPRAALLGSYRWLSADAAPGVNLTAECAQRIHEVTPDSPLLRLSVESGGCSGFSYKFDVDDVVPTDKDQVFERDGARLVIDDLSLDFVKGSTVTYTYGEMIGETFEVQDNPMSEGSCGCGVSFAPSGG